jgi:predicted extracellular nuclease
MKTFFLVFGFFLASSTIGFCQNESFQRYEAAVLKKRGNFDFRIAFYNLENLFDLENDSTTADDSFTPEGSNSYTYNRYKKKSNGLAKTMAALGGWQPPEIIGLCEVESRWVMEGLAVHSPLKNANYQIIHEDSPDRRGIDIACLYNPKRFNLISYRYFRVNFPFDPDRKTRDILYLKGILPNKDTLHVFVNHWPSRYGGQFASEPARAFVAELIKSKVDSLNQRFSNPNIILCGDFNDEPDDLSLKDHLGAKLDPSDAQEGDLVNLMYPIKYKFGTHSFAGEWGVLDHFIVSYSLLRGDYTFTTPESVGVFDAPWLLNKNAAGSDVPHRTYQGPAYKGGYSDHLPIFLDLVLTGEK